MVLATHEQEHYKSAGNSAKSNMAAIEIRNKIFLLNFTFNATGAFLADTEAKLDDKSIDRGKILLKGCLLWG